MKDFISAALTDLLAPRALWNAALVALTPLLASRLLWVALNDPQNFPQTVLTTLWSAAARTTAARQSLAVTSDAPRRSLIGAHSVIAHPVTGRPAMKGSAVTNGRRLSGAGTPAGEEAGYGHV